MNANRPVRGAGLMDNSGLIRAAVLYYEHDMTHAEIGDSLGWSRIKVTRALKEARARGLVEFVIHDPVTPFDNLERALTSTYSLDSCRVGPTTGDPARTLTSLGIVGAEALVEFLPKSGTVTVAMSGALSEVVDQLHGVSLPGVAIAAATGSVAHTTAETTAALAIALARKTGASAYTIPGPLRSAPMVVRALLNEPATAAALDLAANAGHLILGVGSMHKGESRMRDNLDADYVEELVEGGAVGDIATRFFDDDAKHVPSRLDDELLSLEYEQILTIPKKFVVAAGAGKTASVSALLKAEIITDLVVTEDLARGLLSAAQNKEKVG